ncbi:MAG: isoprenylcysteine carboxylmethyltransferase family protein [Betaproteobacteria bacterium]|nr:MAG: isoprenylcysteine carboxylmethyltransferase family protein [Betaproteobacteria bacterium]
MVDDSRDNRSLGTSGPDVANLGLVRPPVVYLGSIALGLVLHLLWPARLVPPPVSTPVGAIVTVLAIALFVSAVRTLQAAGTPIPGNRPTTAIVRTGPYRFSRNPIYLAFSILQLGISIWVNSVWLLATLAGAAALILYVVIRREEQYLERRFGARYLDYKASVRRWL